MQIPRFQPDTSLRKDFADSDHWSELSRKLYIHLPRFGSRASDEDMRRWLRKFRVTEADYLSATGYKELGDFRTLNPDWPLRAWVGILMEYVVERDAAKGVLRAYDRT